jgi:hypothetical protein
LDVIGPTGDVAYPRDRQVFETKPLRFVE